LVMEHINEFISRCLKDGLNEDEEKKYGQEIIDGVTEYIPWIKDAKLLSVIPGIVKSRGAVDINDKDSPFHKRDYSGVEEQQLGWIDNAAMKLFYCLGNAKEVLEIMEKQELAKAEVREIIGFSNFDGQWEELPTRERIVGQAMFNHLQKSLKSSDITEQSKPKIQHDIKEQVMKKGIVLRDVVKFVESKNKTPEF
jgi:hypothetical protein